jgi:hypothetical protein
MKNRLLIVSLMVAGACAGVALGLWTTFELLKQEKPIFRSLAKLVVAHPVDPMAARFAKGLNTEFYGTCIETLESAEMIRKARERVHASHEELEDSDVEIVCRRTEGSGIINILATGSEPKYTQIFLNALLDEYIAWRQIVIEQSQGRELQALLQELVEKQRTMEESQKRHMDVRNQAEPANRKAESERLAARLTELRNQRDKLDLEIKLAANDATREDTTSRHQTLVSEVEKAEKLFNFIEDTGTALEEARKARERAEERYHKIFDLAEDRQREFSKITDVVAIQERATPAAEHTKSTEGRLVASGLSCGVLGALLGWVLAQILSWRPAVRAESQIEA